MIPMSLIALHDHVDFIIYIWYFFKVGFLRKVIRLYFAWKLITFRDIRNKLHFVLTFQTCLFFFATCFDCFQKNLATLFDNSYRKI